MYSPRSLMAAAFLLLWPVAAASEVLLTLTTAEVVREYDRAALEAMPATRFATTTIWTDGEHEFTGVALSDFLAAVGVTSGSLKAYAVNDYAVEIPVSDAVKNGPIIAYAQDGAPMSMRNKGPLWIVYPFSSNPAYQTEVIYARSIWQLDRIEIVE